MAHITRQSLVSAVEQGITAATLHIITNDEKIMLRDVAQTADRVARRTFIHHGCGCPLTQAGIHYNGYDRRKAVISAFSLKFDVSTTRDDDFGYILEVVG